MPKQQVKSITVNNFPVDLWRRFKVKCIGNDEAIKDVLVALIGDYVKSKGGVK